MPVRGVDIYHHRVVRLIAGAPARSEAGPGILPWWPLVALFGYVALVAAVLLPPLLPPADRLLLWIWSTLPAETITIGCAIFVARSPRLSRQRRIAWRLLLASLALSAVGTALWAADWSATNGVAPHTSDSAYVFTYPPLGVLGLYFFLRDLGASRWRLGALLDAVTLTLGIGAALWCFVIVPTTPAGANGMTVLQVATHSVLLIFPAVLAGIVYTHVSDWSEERGLACLLVAAVLSQCGDMLWAGRTVPDRLDDTAVYNLVYLAANVACTLALVLETRRPAAAVARSRSTSYSLMPALVILGCLIALVTTGTPLSASSRHMALGMLIAATAVLAIREALAQRELRQLERERVAAAALLDHDASDRARLFQQVHEGVAQELAGLRLALGASSTDAAVSPHSLHTAVERLGRTITTTRAIANRLAPLQSSRGSLRIALETLQAESAAAGLPCQLDCDELDPNCPAAVAGLVHRVVVHVLDTARKDPPLQSLGIRVASDDSGLRLRIHLRAPASGQPLLDHPDWRALHDRLQVAGGSVQLRAGIDDCWLTVRVPHSGARPQDSD